MKSPDSHTIEEAIRLYNEGVSAAIIAQQFSIACSTLVKHLRKQGVKIRGHYFVNSESVEEAIRLYSDGIPISHISKKLSVSPNTLSRYIKGRGIKIRRRIPTDEDKKLIFSMYKAGNLYPAISKETGFCTSTIGHVLAELRPAKRPNPVTKTESESMATDYREGKTITQLCEKYDRVFTTVTRALKQHGVSIRNAAMNCPTKTKRTFIPLFEPLPLVNLPDCKFAGIYKFTNLFNGKIYIGQSQNIQKRYYSHGSMRFPGLFTNALKKYGIGNFNFEILERVDDLTKIDEREQYWLDFYQSYNTEKGYNIASASGRGTRRGTKCTPEQRAEISKNLRLRYANKPNPMKGRPRPHSQELKELLTSINKTRAKKVLQLDPATGSVIREWSCMLDIVNELGLCSGGIRDAIRGSHKKRGITYIKTTHAGFKWQYAE